MFHIILKLKGYVVSTLVQMEAEYLVSIKIALLRVEYIQYLSILFAHHNKFKHSIFNLARRIKDNGMFHFTFGIA